MNLTVKLLIGFAGVIMVSLFISLFIDFSIPGRLMSGIAFVFLSTAMFVNAVALKKKNEDKNEEHKLFFFSFLFAVNAVLYFIRW
ncbi:hypothetical protein [Alteribacter keqinensis]|uniref:Uncharacterized protein n=1 Tax=Alteribacter keqinensis TaxID=2483800 RepID=A0A3M7TYH3_9BACI|nr:hypothetical protein [Alteribacter keqinensis]RNA69952.1 hypothetical protein EBO34_08480 [Alteribacter keqinensis]